MPNDVSIPERRVQAAAEKWRAQNNESVEELKQCLHLQLSRNPAGSSPKRGGCHFSLDLSDIHLNGLDENVPCVLIAGGTREATDAVKAFWRDVGSKDRIPFVFCLSEESHLAAAQALPEQNALVLSPSDVVTILASDDPRSAIKQQLRQQLARTRLNPYNFIRPAEGNMFFGRQDELGSLLQDRQSSFAIAGPSRIGKSSLLKRYVWELRRRRDPRQERTFLIDCYDCPDGSSESVARHIAVRMGETWSFSRAAHHLLQLLKSRSQALNGPLELLLDEVDGVCFSQAFNYVAEAARKGYVRLVLCGRTNLLNMMHKEDCHLAERLKLLHPEPLEPDAARRLITLPLGDLGFRLDDRDRLLEHFLTMTGRLPGLLQYYGATIVDFALQRGTDSVSMELVREVDRRLETAERFLEPIFELRDNPAAELATLILRDDRLRYEPGDIARLGVSVLKGARMGRIMEIANDLLIQGVLAWEDGGYRIGNGAIRQFARRFGLLEAGRVA